jgi:hypothetical protein
MLFESIMGSFLDKPNCLIQQKIIFEITTDKSVKLYTKSS